MTKKGKKESPPFALENADGVITGMSMSFDKDGDEPVSRRTFTIAVIERNEEQVDAHLGIYTWRSWFNNDAATKRSSPMPWVGKCNGGGQASDDKFDVKSLSIKCGSRVLKFESEQHEDGEGETAAGKIKGITYTPDGSGIVHMSLKLSVRPDPDQAALLEEYYNRHVKVSLGEVNPARDDKPKQGELPVGRQGNGTPGDEATVN